MLTRNGPEQPFAGPLLGPAGTVAEEDPIFALLQAYRQDDRTGKVDLGIGVYRDSLNRSPVFRAVKAAEQWRVDTEADKAYIGPLGDQAFCEAIAELALGQPLADQLSTRLACAQTPGGVGALRLAFELLKQMNPDVCLWLSDSTWQVHRPIAEASGTGQGTYAYYNPQQGRQGFDVMLASLQAAKPGDAVLLQASCHNPTGLDLSADEWRELAVFCQQRQLLPIVDMAYHGLGNGLEADATGLRIMAREMPELLLCYTCSKNFGLYRDRTGMVAALVQNEALRQPLMQQWMQLATRHYFTPPAHGAMLVRRILQDEDLRAIWQQELEKVDTRLRGVRDALYSALSKAVPQRNWQFLQDGQGMFALFPLSVREIQHLQQAYGVYIVSNGRVNLSGFNDTNLPTIVAHIAATVSALASGSYQEQAC
ncbi:amino acid aminotransferase [Aliamphritea hakodatensis]|uniref:amino acid aminotransferase n=1 Tax=Aliamphritea hakodatensis TaxID=2895352 RepID=UPI0022FD9184|nr:aromatic amino acid transaminase [Aliamphritea hakodatensis]